MWWIREYLGKNHLGRPNIFEVIDSKNLEFSGITLKNSPYYHHHWKRVENVHFHDFEIFVDIWSQLTLGDLFFGIDANAVSDGNGFSFRVPSYPLNTDGIDPEGRNILIERVNITNYDDAVAVKPLQADHHELKCTENVMVRDIIVH